MNNPGVQELGLAYSQGGYNSKLLTIVLTRTRQKEGGGTRTQASLVGIGGTR